jgi:hypothetical protein
VASASYRGAEHRVGFDDGVSELEQRRASAAGARQRREQRELLGEWLGSAGVGHLWQRLEDFGVRLD